MDNNHTITVYFDGACALCVREIALLRRLDQKRTRIRFEDVSPADAIPSCDISRARLLARFHAQLSDGRVVDGAQAFTEAWSQIPFMIWVRPLGRWGPSRAVINAAYGQFLRVRPQLQRWVSGKSTGRTGH